MNRKVFIAVALSISALWLISMVFVYEAGKFDGWNEATAYESCDVAKRVMFFGNVVTDNSIF